MPKFIKKPVTIEAIRYQSDDADSLFHLAQGQISGFIGQLVVYNPYSKEITFDGVHGKVTAKPGDWIIKQNNDDFYPCTDEVFQANYIAAPETWLDRVKLEKERVQKDFDALNKTLNVDEKPDFIANEQWLAMIRQSYAMDRYLEILNYRIEQAEGAEE